MSLLEKLVAYLVLFILAVVSFTLSPLLGIVASFVIVPMGIGISRL